jgi:hypothetical protein
MERMYGVEKVVRALQSGSQPAFHLNFTTLLLLSDHTSPISMSRTSRLIAHKLRSNSPRRTRKIPPALRASATHRSTNATRENTAPKKSVWISRHSVQRNMAGILLVVIFDVEYG